MALCATTACLCVRGARGRFGGVGAGTWRRVSFVSPSPPRVFRAACGGPSRPGVPYPRSLVLLLALGLRLRLWVGLGSGDRLEVGEELRARGVCRLLWGAGTNRVVVRWLPAACSPAAALALALAVALWMRATGRGEEVDDEDQDKEKDQEEVVVLEDAGGAVLRVGEALRAAVAFAAATAGRMEAISWGCGVGVGGCSGPVAFWQSGGPMGPAAVCGGGVGLRSPPSGLG